MGVVSAVAKVVFGVVITGVALDKTVFPIITVVGDSMNPTYKNGEHFIARKVYDPQKLEKGDVVILNNPSTYGHDILVKRIDGFKLDDLGNKAEVFVLGDNINNSYDSKEFGFFPLDRIKYVAIHSRKKEVCDV